MNTPNNPYSNNDPYGDGSRDNESSNYDSQSHGFPNNGSQDYNPYGVDSDAQHGSRGPEDSPQWNQAHGREQAYGDIPSYGTGEPSENYGGQPYGAESSYWQQPAGGNPAAGALAPGVNMPGGNEPPVKPVAQGPTKVDIGSAFSAAFRSLNSNFASWLGVMLTFFAVLVALIVGAAAILFASGDFDPEFEPNYPGDVPFEDLGSMFATVGAMALLFAVGMFAMQAFMLRGAFEAVDGRVPNYGTFFRVNRWGSLIGVYIVTFLVGLLAMLPGMVLFIAGVSLSANGSEAAAAMIPLGYLVLLLTSIFIMPITATMPLLVFDGRATALEAPVVAWRLVKPQYWTMLVAFILTSIVSSAGAMLFYIGILYTMPLAMLVQVHIYRQLIGGRRVINEAQENPGYYPPQQ
ncbi:hypothetical protein QP991_10185 [Corynebacterium amycolatum]|uniref:hypothetical protein n=1 Tax=Corynebacterium amycolatum TaxID=43765 RepID=UPI00254B58D4|nr:hypothetical protein [Corynebacterium amycolatum]MDK8819881.1 hypothetical protein [Corynebacterium amycolatum]